MQMEVNNTGKFHVSWKIQNALFVQKTHFIHSRTISATDSFSNFWELRFYPKGTRRVKEKVFCGLQYFGFSPIYVLAQFRITCGTITCSNNYEPATLVNSDVFYSEMMDAAHLSKILDQDAIFIQCFLEGFQGIPLKLHHCSMLTSLHVVCIADNFPVKYCDEVAWSATRMRRYRFCATELKFSRNLHYIHIDIRLRPFTNCTWRYVQFEVELLNNHHVVMHSRNVYSKLTNRPLHYKFVRFFEVDIIDRFPHEIVSKRQTIQFNFTVRAHTGYRNHSVNQN